MDQAYFVGKHIGDWEDGADGDCDSTTFQQRHLSEAQRRSSGAPARSDGVPWNCLLGAKRLI
jgi:hypothetical protein